MSASPFVRMLIASLSFGGGVAAGLLAASLARHEARQRRTASDPDRAWRYGGHAYTDELPDAERPITEELDLFEEPELETDLADHARRP